MPTSALYSRKFFVCMCGVIAALSANSCTRDNAKVRTAAIDREYVFALVGDGAIHVSGSSRGVDFEARLPVEIGSGVVTSVLCKVGNRYLLQLNQRRLIWASSELDFDLHDRQIGLLGAVGRHIGFWNRYPCLLRKNEVVAIDPVSMTIRKQWRMKPEDFAISTIRSHLPAWGNAYSITWANAQGTEINSDNPHGMLCELFVAQFTVAVAIWTGESRSPEIRALRTHAGDRIFRGATVPARFEEGLHTPVVNIHSNSAAIKLNSDAGRYDLEIEFPVPLETMRPNWGDTEPSERSWKHEKAAYSFDGSCAWRVSEDGMRVWIEFSDGRVARERCDSWFAEATPLAIPSW